MCATPKWQPHLYTGGRGATLPPDPTRVQLPCRGSLCAFSVQHSAFAALWSTHSDSKLLAREVFSIRK